MRINGEPYPFHAGLHLHAVLQELELNPQQVAVLHIDAEGLEHIYPAQHIPDVALAASDQLEIVQLLQGG